MRTKARSAFIASAVLTLAMTACSSASTSPAGGTPNPKHPIVIHLGTQAWIGYGPWAIAIKNGLDKANGIEIKQTPFNAGQDEISAINAGRPGRR